MKTNTKVKFIASDACAIIAACAKAKAVRKSYGGIESVEGYNPEARTYVLDLVKLAWTDGKTSQAAIDLIKEQIGSGGKAGFATLILHRCGSACAYFATGDKCEDIEAKADAKGYSYASGGLSFA